MTPLKLLTLSLVVIYAHSATLVDLLGLTYLYEGMGVVSQTTLSNGTTTTTYQVSPENYAFLSQFETLTDFCDYKC